MITDAPRNLGDAGILVQCDFAMLTVIMTRFSRKSREASFGVAFSGELRVFRRGWLGSRSGSPGYSYRISRAGTGSHLGEGGTGRGRALPRKGQKTELS